MENNDLKKFDKLTSEFISSYFDWNPQYGTYLGLHKYDGKIPDLSKDAINSQLKKLKDYKDKFDSIKNYSLETEKQLDLEILKLKVNEEILSIEEYKHQNKNPMTYTQAFDVSIYIQRDFAPAEERLNSIISIIKNAENVFESAKENLEESLPEPFIDTAIQILEGNIHFFKNDLTSFAKEVKNEKLTGVFIIANHTAIKVMQDFASYLLNEKKPNSNQDYPIGRELYSKMLECENVYISPDEILSVGMRELRNNQKLFAETAARIDQEKDAREVFNELKKHHPTEASLIEDTKTNLEKIKQFVIDKNIIIIPDSNPVEVKETPVFLRSMGFAMMNSPGAFESHSKEAFYYVTPPDEAWDIKRKNEWLSTFCYFINDIISIHEAYPGHYVQFLHLNRSKVSDVRKIFSSYAFIEGWAHYAEQMMIEEGFGKNHDVKTEEKYKLAQLNEAIIRLCRLCVSVNMHCNGMTIEQGKDFFMENAYLERQPALSEATRGSFDPGYLFYTLGKLMILKLRQDYKSENDNFNLQAFNNAVVDNGMCPLPLLRTILLKSPGKEIL